MKMILCVWLSILNLFVHAQITSGLTHVHDTSFNVTNEYNKNKKKYPDLKIVELFSLQTIREKKNIVYCSLGERKLQLDAFYPAKKSKGRTAIMIIHGGGWRSGDRTQHHPLAQRFADLGYVCFTPEYRLSTEALYPAAVYDLKAVLQWIHAHAKEYCIDTNKIAVLGFSAGGELAAFLAATNYNKQYQSNLCNSGYSTGIHALIDLDGTLSFVHPESGEGDDRKKISAATYWFGYSKKDNYKLWEDTSPLTHAGKNTPPTLFINSSVERMHAGRNDFIKILNQYNVYSEVKTFEDAPHSFPLFDPWFEPTVKYVDDFLKKIFSVKKR
jgi:pectinesterase